MDRVGAMAVLASWKGELENDGAPPCVQATVSSVRLGSPGASPSTLAAVGGSQHGGLFGPGAIAMRGKLVAPFVSQRLVGVQGDGNEADLASLAAMIEAGDITPVIDRAYPLEEAPDALRYVEEGYPKGKVVVTVGDDLTSSRS